MKIQTLMLRIVGTLLAATLLVGFRVFPHADLWRISREDPKLWVKFCSRPEMSSNDLHKDDPLYGQPVSFDLLTQMVLDNFNNVETSYVRLYDADKDPLFASSDTLHRIIDVCIDSADGPYGLTMRRGIEGQMITCNITIKTAAIGTARGYLHVLTHELGHCLGLDHPQDTVFAIMSYFSGDIRLQIDDKMGLTYLYPTDPSYAEEVPTLGASCAPKEPAH